jgi:hypothetical protein
MTMALPVSTVNTVANPLSNVANSSGVGAVAPNLGITAGSAPGAGGLTQGTALPNITTTQTQATATPQFYTDYLNNLATQGNTAAKTAQFVGPTGMQEQAFGTAMQNVGNYQPTLNKATELASNVGDSNISGALGNLNQSNIANYLAPQATAGIVGTGQFGSSRGVGALGQVINQANIATQAQQAQAMQQDQANRIAAAGQLGSLANTTQSLGLGDVNALATLGAQQQQIAQNQQLFPMQQLTAESNLLKGATIPTATSSSYTGPIPGAYNASPLAQIAGLGTLAKDIPGLIPGINSGIDAIKNAAGTLGGSIFTGLKDIFGNTTTPAVPVDTSTGTSQNGQDLSYGSPVQGTGPNGGAGAGQVLGTNGNIYTDPTYGTGYQQPPQAPDLSQYPDMSGLDGFDYSQYPQTPVDNIDYSQYDYGPY